MIIGIGTDIVKVERIEKAIEKWGMRFLKRVFTGTELEYCKSRAREGIHFAARFAAKEAFRKASGRKLNWNDVEIINEEEGKPVVRMIGKFSENDKKSWKSFISISHTDEYAIAYVLIQLKNS